MRMSPTAAANTTMKTVLSVSFRSTEDTARKPPIPGRGFESFKPGVVLGCPGGGRLGDLPVYRPGVERTVILPGERVVVVTLPLTLGEVNGLTP